MNDNLAIMAKMEARMILEEHIAMEADK